MLKKYYLLFVYIYILFFNFINLSSSSDSNFPTFDLIVDTNKINSNGECGDSLNNSCNSIQEAIAYFSKIKNQPENINSNLVLKLVDGTYRGDLNSFSFYGWNITISTYTIGSNKVTIDGSTLEKTFISILKLNSTLNNSILKLSNINIINFNSSFLVYRTSSPAPNNDYTKITFDSCQISNCYKDFNIYLNGAPSSSSNNGFNSIDFINTKFENINITSQLFNFLNFKVHFISSNFKTITLGNYFYNNILGTNSLIIDSSTFNEIKINSGKEFLITYKNGSLVIKNSEYNNMKISNSFLINANYNSDEVTITNNTFTNINDGFIHLLNGDVNLKLNKIINNNNNNGNSNVIDASDSNLYFDENSINYPNARGSIICVNSKIIFTNNNGDSLNQYPICSDCNIMYNGNQICSIYPSSGSTTTTTTASTSTTSPFTTSTSTTGGGKKHTSNSINSKKSVSLPLLLCILLVLITLLNL
ncbi:hypothetical protein DDB_G0295819 [Dictyostelium discoideum AX4]|uniref:Right handed beta helix domain-containing protein n=1 Tax=Dictyostelium discoideum TaxID=44689 RepID=C7FZX9_DICDI|nr:hypothetical protein DDB_G0295819 [Dictyostelium discoideum AX4]EEU04143.1 hypothetical protein DDB_G0295819 [Dictyostelium discoideum AX4]|eukprot:XP_002649193.1 hypothetical protein DDB_G0295819 [Dictyostelium discoideum AX4]